MRRPSSPAQQHAGADHVVSLLQSGRLNWFLQHFPPRLVQSVYVFVNGFINWSCLGSLVAICAPNIAVLPVPPGC